MEIAIERIREKQIIIKDNKLDIGFSTNPLHYETIQNLLQILPKTALWDNLQDVGVQEVRTKNIGGQKIIDDLGKTFDYNYYTKPFGHANKNKLVSKLIGLDNSKLLEERGFF